MPSISPSTISRQFTCRRPWLGYLGHTAQSGPSAPSGKFGATGSPWIRRNIAEEPHFSVPGSRLTSRTNTPGR